MSWVFTDGAAVNMAFATHIDFRWRPDELKNELVECAVVHFRAGNELGQATYGPDMASALRKWLMANDFTARGTSYANFHATTI